MGSDECANFMSGVARDATTCYVWSSAEPHDGDECTVAYDSCKYTVRHSKGPFAGGMMCRVPTERENSVDAECEILCSDFVTIPFEWAKDKLCGCACPVKKAYSLHGRSDLWAIMYEECEMSPGDDLTDVGHRDGTWATG